MIGDISQKLGQNLNEMWPGKPFWNGANPLHKLQRLRLYVSRFAAAGASAPAACASAASGCDARPGDGVRGAVIDGSRTGGAPAGSITGAGFALASTSHVGF